MDTRSPSSSCAPLVVAHRAGNCLDALREAERLGVSLVEADLRLFRGRVEVRHLKSVGPLPLYWDRWRVAAPWSRHLTLDALLAATGPGTELLLDLKGRRARLGELVAQAIAPLLPGRRFTVCAREPRPLEPLRDLAVRRLRSVGTPRQLRALLRGGTNGAHGVSVHARLLNAATARDLRRVTDFVLTWPVDRAEDARRLGELGVDGLISDAPGVLLGAGARG